MKFKRIQCIDRALDIMNVIGNGKCHTVNEIALKVSLNQFTVYNIVKTLEARGFITNSSGVYLIGPALGLLASDSDVKSNLPLLSKPILEEVNEKTGESVCLTIMDGFQAEIVNLMHGIRQVSVQFLHRTWNYPLNLATGRLLIALSNPADWPLHIERHLSGTSKNLDEQNWNYQNWQAHLDTLRNQDYSMLKLSPPDHEAEFIGAVAAPLRNTGGILVGVIGSSCPLNRATDEHLLFMKNCIASAIASHKLI